MVHIVLFPELGVYIDYNFSGDEDRIRTLLKKKLDLELELPEFRHVHCQGKFPVNFGYDASSDKRYNGVRARYHRSVFVDPVSLENALSRLSDANAYQCLSFAYQDAETREDFGFNAWKIHSIPNEVKVDISTQHYKGRRIRNRILRQFRYEVIYESRDSYRKFYRIDASFIDVCEAVVDRISTTKWKK